MYTRRRHKPFFSPAGVICLIGCILPLPAFPQHYIYDDGTVQTTLILEDDLFSFVVFGPDGHRYAYGNVTERNGDTLLFDSWNDYSDYRFRISDRYVADAAGADIQVCDASGAPIAGMPVTVVAAGVRRSLYFPGKTGHTDLARIDSVGVYGVFFPVSPGFAGTLTLHTPFAAESGIPLYFSQERFVLTPDRRSISPTDRERFGNLRLYRKD